MNWYKKSNSDFHIRENQGKILKMILLYFKPLIVFPNVSYIIFIIVATYLRAYYKLG